MESDLTFKVFIPHKDTPQKHLNIIVELRTTRTFFLGISLEEILSSKVTKCQQRRQNLDTCACLEKPGATVEDLINHALKEYSETITSAEYDWPRITLTTQKVIKKTYSLDSFWDADAQALKLSLIKDSPRKLATG